MSPTDPVWDLDPHTRGKHLVLRNYLNAWFPILSSLRQRVLFIDGFAGPGHYKGGEEGSPLIAIRCVREHIAASKMEEVGFVFIEADKRRADLLVGSLDKLASEGLIPKNCKLAVEHGAFDESLTKTLDLLDAQRKRLAPAFVMIDPFGVSGTPMSLIERLFRNDRVEVYVSFMYEFMNRFKATDEFAAHLDALFGTERWRDGVAIEEKLARKNFFFDLYERQLRSAGARYSLRFELYAAGRLKYGIFFGTKHLLGVDRMKQAIWKVAPTGDFAFHGGRNDQLVLSAVVDNVPLRRAIADRLRAETPGAWTTIETIHDHVVAETDYHSSQFKRPVLTPMEKAGEIDVERPPGSRTGFKDGTRIRWKRA